MAHKTAHDRSLSGKIAAAVRRGKVTPEIEGYRRDLRAARLEDHIKLVVAQMPPLTDGQVSRLVDLLVTSGEPE